MVNEVWLGIIGIPWVKGHKMFLTYTELIFLETSLMSRTVKTSFQYTFQSSSNQVVMGRVQAIADGTLQLKTNKRSDTRKYCIWSKQRCPLYVLKYSMSSRPY